jgi:hypothetical protein
MKGKRRFRLKIEKIRSANMDKSTELDWTFSANPRTKGTYSRRLSDIRLATGKFSTAKLPADSPARFLGYYFGCEKLAKAILGVARLWPAERAFDHKTPLDLEQLKTAAKKLGIAFADPDLTKIFGTQPAPAKPTFGREIRNRLIHDFGPSNVDHAKAAAKVLTPTMMRFLACEHQTQEYIAKLNIHHRVAQKGRLLPLLQI